VEDSVAVSCRTKLRYAVLAHCLSEVFGCLVVIVVVAAVDVAVSVVLVVVAVAVAAVVLLSVVDDVAVAVVVVVVVVVVVAFAAALLLASAVFVLRLVERSFVMLSWLKRSMVFDEFVGQILASGWYCSVT